ncbi:hypothetical protein RJ640_005103 [Escallonia rubra]|uniref:Ty3 transposon capsid-like protein domain-containing protein n=1 Tax=Escallonia rubra TaxID=112253 RepID=A0AA88UL47_9ASTE|nr:hypothetical protein RJ640_005103 [Escallonia rubra]
MGYNTRQGKKHQLDEHVSLMEAQFADHFGAIDDQLMGLRETVSEISDLKLSVDQLKDKLLVVRQSLTELRQMMHQLIHLKEGEGSRSGSRQSKSSKGSEQLYKEYQQTTTDTPPPKLPKLEFPRLSGEDSYGWVRKADKYFEYNHADEQHKVNFASVHFDGQVEFWFGTFIKAKGKVSWLNFVRDLHARFCSLFRESVIGEFHKLRQATTVEQYYNDFETLRSILVSEGCKFEEDYFIQSFISGLKDDIRLEVENFDVGDLSRAIFLARRQEASLNNAKRIENGVFLGPLGWLTFEGRFSWKKRILAFIFERIRIKVGPFNPFDINFKGRDESEPSSKNPFFIWFYVDEEIAVARGRSGDVLISAHNLPITSAEASLLSLLN